MKHELTEHEIKTINWLFIEGVAKGYAVDYVERGIKNFKKSIEDGLMSGIFEDDDVVMRNDKVYLTNKTLIKRILINGGEEVEDWELPDELELENL